MWQIWNNLVKEKNYCVIWRIAQVTKFMQKNEC